VKIGSRVAFIIGFIMLGSAVAWADLEKVKAERNLERRSRAAIENADRALKEAREAYNRGDMEQAEAGIAEVRESVDLAKTSLVETGRNPRRSPRWFKRAEIALRDLIKRLDAFHRDMNVADREMLEETIARVHEVHEAILLGLMEGKRK
jgi:hypothetical protein